MQHTSQNHELRKRLRELMRGRKAASGPRQRVGGSDVGPLCRGEVTIETRERREDGTVGEWSVHQKDSNLVVTQAEALMAAMSIGSANHFDTATAYMQVGEDGTAPALDNTALLTPVAPAAGGTKVLGSATAAGSVATLQATWAIGDTLDGYGLPLSEVGLFVGGAGAPITGGTMFARKVFNPITKTGAFDLRITWAITFNVSQNSDSCTNISLIGPSTVTSEFIATEGVTAGFTVASTFIAMPFDFAVGGGHIDVYQNGVRKLRSLEYIEATSGGAKGISFITPVVANDVWYFVHRVLS